MEINKGYLESKTLWVALITALVPLFPEVEEVIKSNPQVVLVVVSGVFSVLRLITSKKLGKK